MTKNYEQAEDLTHETFLKAYMKYDSFKEQSSEKTWLFSIAHNLTMDFFRKRRPVMLLKGMFVKKDNEKQPVDIIQIKEESNELYNALIKIKDTYRNVLILRKIKGFSIEETAIILGWSESKVKSTQLRAINALKKTLEKESYFDEKAN
jgi:RNA polymerase sigma-70 factor (ECF subfamily)